METLNRLTEKIIGCSIEVHRRLGPGLLESLCEKALCIDLKLGGYKLGFQMKTLKKSLCLLSLCGFILIGCTRPPLESGQSQGANPPQPVLSYSIDRTTVTAVIPHNSAPSGQFLDQIQGIQPRLGIAPYLMNIQDDSLKSMLMKIILDDAPEDLFEYKIENALMTNRSMTLTYQINQEAIGSHVQPILNTYASPGTKPILPLFSRSVDTPDPAVFSNLHLPFPCDGISIPTQALLLPNAPRTYRNGIHRGLDFYVNWGTPVRAVADGRIIRADHDFREVSPEFRVSLLEKTKQVGHTPSDIFEHVLLGRAVFIDHGVNLIPGYRAVTIYAHLSHISPELIPGSEVISGQIIGKTGNTGTRDSTLGKRAGAHLHWELLIQDREGEYYLGQGIPYQELYPLLMSIFNGAQAE